MADETRRWEHTGSGEWELRRGQETEAKVSAMGLKQHIDLYVDHDTASSSFTRDRAGRINDPVLTKELDALRLHIRQSPEQAYRFKPANELNNREIVAEARELHSHFKQLSEQYSQAPAAQRPQLREEMEPLVDRERALRQEYTGRATQELVVDRAPEMQIAYGR